MKHAYLEYHILAFLGGFLLDLLLGDPYSLPHPVRAMGSWIGFLERHYLGPKGKEKETSAEVRRKQGALTVLWVLLAVGAVAALVFAAAYWIHPLLGCLVELVMTYQMLATKCLKVESMKVYDRLKNGTLPEARKAVSMIVGRDTQELDEAGVARAAVETVAENTSDGVIAPMLCLAIGGPILGFLYKAVNTMDSMIGYKNDRYLDYGRAAAKLDDAVNFLPSRISALLMIFSCLFLGKDFHTAEAKRIYLRDRRKHASPNSAQTESVCAGALGLRLAGDAKYFGKVVKKPFIGDPVREIEAEDIRRANQLLYATAFWCEWICIMIMLCLCYLFCR